MTSSSSLELSSYLLELDDHEFRRLQGCEADHDIDHAAIDIALRGGFAVALHEVGCLWRFAWKAPWRNRSCIKTPTLSRICAHSGSSFGSNTTHCVPR